MLDEQLMNTTESQTTDSLTSFEEDVEILPEEQDNGELSGSDWVDRFPTSIDIEDLVSPFRENVSSFVTALQNAGANVSISATHRPEERAYLMHWSFRIARKGYDPRTVPEMEEVDINWMHTDESGNYSSEDSIQAARDMVNAYGIVYQPALTSNHIRGTAIDMTITWSGSLRILNAEGQEATIASTPRNGADNTELHTVGQGYSVLKLVSDRPHWSENGR